MTNFEPGDAEIIDRLQAEFRQPVPTEISQAHLGRIQKITASQALSVRNRYRASLAVAAAAVGVLGLQLSTSVFNPPETLAPAAAPAPTTEAPPLVAQVDPGQQESDDGTRRLIGRPAAATDNDDDPSNDVEASVAVLDSVSDDDGSSEPTEDDSPSTATTAVTGSAVSVTSVDNDGADTDSDAGSTSDSNSDSTSDSESQPATSILPTTSTTVRSTQATTASTISTTTTAPDTECEELDGKGSSNAFRRGGPYSPTTASSFPGQSGPPDCKSNSSAAKSNAIQGSDNGLAQGLQPK